jgi:hypothetical protein
MRGVRAALTAGAAAAEEQGAPIAAAAGPSAHAPASAARPPGRGPSRLTPVRLGLALGLTLLAVALGVVLSHAPQTVAGTNGVQANLAVTYVSSAQIDCQSDGTLPQGTDALRVSLSANIGPRVGVRVLSGSTLVTEGEHAAGWGVDETVTVPVKRVAQTVASVVVCTTIGPVVEPLQINGTRVQGPKGVGFDLRVEYLRPGPRSWLSLVASTARDMGLDHAPNGSWVAYLLIAVMLAVVIISSRLLLRELRDSTSMPAAVRALRRVPRAAWTCALLAFLSAACWSLITPPFQAPDEPSHFAYAQLLAQTGRLPDSNNGAVSQQELEAVKGLHQYEVQWHPEVHTPTSLTAQRELSEDLTLPLNRVGPGGAGVAASEPPLYYALEAGPYYLGASGTLLDSLELMRLLSALMAGVTALFTFLFVREALPGVPWAWTVGGLGAAITPLLGFTSGAVTPEAMLYAVAAAIFYFLARAFRHGLTRRRAVAIGTLTAIGFLTKVNFFGLAPGVMLGLVVLGFRGIRAEPGGERARRALGSAALALALAVSPICVYVASNLLKHHAALGLVSSAAKQTGAGGSLLTDLLYVWQFYLPHLPGMPNYFPGISMLRQVWFARAVGFYGWLDTIFPVWVDNLALIPAALISLLGLRTLGMRRGALRARTSELLVYLVMAVGLAALIGADFAVHRAGEGAGWAQPRYLVPLLPLAAAALALAARGAGRRWGPFAGSLIVVLLLAQDIFGQLLTVARFYG